MEDEYDLPGFLGENERRYIDRVGDTPTADLSLIPHHEAQDQDLIERETPTDKELPRPNQTHYDIRNDYSRPHKFKNVFRGFRQDIERIGIFNRKVRDDQPVGEWEFEDLLLPSAEHEIRHLRDVCDKLLSKIDQDGREYVEEELKDRMSPLLDVAQVDGADIGDGRDTPGEISARKDALVGVLKEPGLLEILQYLDEGNNRKVPKNEPLGDNNWRRAATNKLQKKHGLLQQKDWNHVYTITERGEAVLDTWRQLRQMPLLEDVEDDEAKARYIRIYADYHIW